MNFIDTNLVKETGGIYNRVDKVASSSNLTTHNAINVKNHKQICFNFSYYIPNQDRTGQGIYFGITTGSYSNAFSAIYLTEGVTSQTDLSQCVEITNDNYLFYPFIEIYNGHTVNPYEGYVANAYIYLRSVLLH